MSYIIANNMHKNKNVLLGPFQVHARLQWEGCEHLLLRCSEGGDGAGRWSRGGSHEGSADFLSCGHPDEHLVVHDAQTVAQEEHSGQILRLNRFRYFKRCWTSSSWLSCTIYLHVQLPYTLNLQVIRQDLAKINVVWHNCCAINPTFMKV